VLTLEDESEIHLRVTRAGPGEQEGALHDVRCACGSLVARRTAAGIELKCRRCRRALLLRIAADGSVSLDAVAGGEE